MVVYAFSFPRSKDRLGAVRDLERTCVLKIEGVEIKLKERQPLKIPSSKAIGCNGLSRRAKVLISHYSSGLPSLPCYELAFSICTGSFPSTKKRFAHVTPLFKKGSRKDPGKTCGNISI